MSVPAPVMLVPAHGPVEVLRLLQPTRGLVRQTGLELYGASTGIRKGDCAPARTLPTKCAAAQRNCESPPA